MIFAGRFFFADRLGENSWVAGAQTTTRDRCTFKHRDHRQTKFSNFGCVTINSFNSIKIKLPSLQSRKSLPRFLTRQLFEFSKKQCLTKQIRFCVVPIFISLLTCCFVFGIQQEDSVTVSPPSKETRETFKLDDFYQKHVLIDGFPIVGSKDVSDAAIREAKWIAGKMLDGRSDILKAMAANNTRLAVMAFNEYTTDIPEHRKLKPRIYWDRRARGLGATPKSTSRQLRRRKSALSPERSIFN